MERIVPGTKVGVILVAIIMILFMLHRRAYASACADACAHAWTILCCEVERMILTSDPNKRIVLVLNKIDLVRPSPRGRQRAICKCQPTQTYTHTCATGNVHWSSMRNVRCAPLPPQRSAPPGSASRRNPRESFFALGLCLRFRIDQPRKGNCTLRPTGHTGVAVLF